MVIAFAPRRHGDDAVAADARQPGRCSCCCPGVVFFGWGEIFSLFPSTLTDTFGTKHATANYGFLYMAQGVGSVLGGPVAALLHQSHRLVDSGLRGHHHDGLRDRRCSPIVALKPMRRRWLDGTMPMVVPGSNAAALPDAVGTISYARKG